MKHLAALLCWLLVSSAPGLQADVFLSNFGETQAGGFRQSRSDQWLATRFTTNAVGSSFDLDSVTLAMGSELDPGGNFFVAIYSNSGSNTPSAQIGGNLTGSSAPTTSGNYTYTASGISLSPNTSYWVVAGVSSGSANYRAAHNETNGAAGGWTIPGSAALYYSSNSGSSWGGLGEQPLRYSISATAAVPEPTHWAALAAAGALGLALWQRRKLRR